MSDLACLAIGLIVDGGDGAWDGMGRARSVVLPRVGRRAEIERAGRVCDADRAEAAPFIGGGGVSGDTTLATSGHCQVITVFVQLYDLIACEIVLMNAKTTRLST
jgi:hypothetical protein